jgi:hypothetical protein
MGDIPEGDPTKGAKVFKQRCAQCHTVEKVYIYIYVIKSSAVEQGIWGIQLHDSPPSLWLVIPCSLGLTWSF